MVVGRYVLFEGMCFVRYGVLLYVWWCIWVCVGGPWEGVVC